MRTLTLRGRGPNTMSIGMLEETERAIDEAKGEPILLTGEGSAFSAGLDLDALATLDADGVRRLLEGIERVAVRLFMHPAPTVALINGHAIAGGCLVAQCCDLRIAARDPKLRIGMTGVAIGLTYPPIVLEVFRARLSAPAVETVLLSAERFDVDRALALGLVDELAAPDEARAVAETRLAERAALPRTSYAATKLSLRAPRLAASESERGRFLEEVVPRWTAALLRR